MKNIEVEPRSFITKEQYGKLIRYFNKRAKRISKERQVTYYFSGQHDLRIQKSNDYAKVWMKKGKIHDQAREEIEIKFAKEDFDLIYKLFLNLGFKKEIEWRRQRQTYRWGKISTMIDYSEGYGYIIEMEVMTDNQNKEKALKSLEKRFDELGIAITPRKEFEREFSYYKKNWQKLLKNKNQNA